MKIRIEVQLDYQFASPTDILLPEQTIENAHIDISESEHFARVPAHDTVGERIWLRAEGRFTVDYRATVSINRLLTDCLQLPKVPPHHLPGETVQYLMPSLLSVGSVPELRRRHDQQDRRITVADGVRERKSVH